MIPYFKGTASNSDWIQNDKTRPVSHTCRICLCILMRREVCPKFCTKYLISWVHRCLKCIHTERYAKMQFSIHSLKTVQNWVWNDEHFTPSTSAILGTSWKWRNGVSLLANVSICLLANPLLATTAHLRQALTPLCVFGLYATDFRLSACNLPLKKQ